MFTDHSGGLVHCMWIPYIEHLDTCGRYAWGADVLSFLYRELYKCCKTDKEEVAAFLILLQLWAQHFCVLSVHQLMPTFGLDNFQAAWSQVSFYNFQSRCVLIHVVRYLETCSQIFYFFFNVCIVGLSNTLLPRKMGVLYQFIERFWMPLPHHIYMGTLPFNYH